MQNNAVVCSAPVARTRMQAAYGQLRRRIAFVIIVACGAVVSLLALTSTDGLLKSALQSSDAELTAISQRAERLQMFARHIRPASLPAEQEFQLPYAGVVSSYGQIQPGSRITLHSRGTEGRLVEVHGLRKIDASIHLSAKQEQGGDLFLVSARLIGVLHGPDIQFLVTVNAPRPLNDTAAEQRSL